MRMRSALCLLTALGCSPSSSQPPPASARSAAREAESPSPEPPKRLADAGPFQAALTAKLSRTGHELSLVLETPGPEAKPVAIAQPAIVARATRAGDPREYVLTFDPAPAADEPAGQCSRFVAKAGWLKPDDVLTIKCDLELHGKRRAVVWKEFVPRKYGPPDDAADPQLAP